MILCTLDVVFWGDFEHKDWIFPLILSSQLCNKSSPAPAAEQHLQIHRAQGTSPRPAAATLSINHLWLVHPVVLFLPRLIKA